MAKRSTGGVRWFDGSIGYGCIDAEDGEGVFVHHTHEVPSLLLEGDQVAFFISYTMDRGPQAIDVSHLNSATALARQVPRPAWRYARRGFDT